MIEPPKLCTVARKMYDLKDLEILAQLAIESDIHHIDLIKRQFCTLTSLAGLSDFAVGFCQLQLIVLDRFNEMRQFASNPYNVRLQPSASIKNIGALNFILSSTNLGIPNSSNEALSKVKSSSNLHETLGRASTMTASEINSVSQDNHDSKQLQKAQGVKKFASYVESPQYLGSTSGALRSWRLRAYRSPIYNFSSQNLYKKTSDVKLLSSNSNLLVSNSRISLASKSFEHIDSFESTVLHDSSTKDSDEQNIQTSSLPSKDYSNYEKSLQELLREAQKIDEEIHAKLNSGHHEQIPEIEKLGKQQERQVKNTKKVVSSQNINN